MARKGERNWITVTSADPSSPGHTRYVTCPPGTHLLLYPSPSNTHTHTIDPSSHRSTTTRYFPSFSCPPCYLSLLQLRYCAENDAKRRCVFRVNGYFEIGWVIVSDIVGQFLSCAVHFMRTVLFLCPMSHRHLLKSQV